MTTTLLARRHLVIRGDSCESPCPRRWVWICCRGLAEYFEFPERCRELTIEVHSKRPLGRRAKHARRFRLAVADGLRDVATGDEISWTPSLILTLHHILSGRRDFWVVVIVGHKYKEKP